MKKTHSTGVVLQISLICIFAILSALLIYMGNEAYRQIISTREYNNDLRTTLAYLSGKVRTADSTEGIEIKEKGGIEVLSISDGSCETLIYYHNGQINEAYVDKTDEFKPEFGEKIAEVKAYNALMEDNKVVFDITTESDEQILIKVSLEH